MIHEAVTQLAAKKDIGYDMAYGVMNEIMTGQASDVLKSAYLTALAMKGETIEEISGSAAAMRDHALVMPHEGDALEIVGTGGDGFGSFNISTTAAFVISAAGVPVAKHGNRAASSKCGAADVLEALGANIKISPERSAQIFKEIGMCFMFAQVYHIAMKYVGPIRKELGIRTVFNILGPITNPARTNLQVLGVYDEAIMDDMAKVLTNLGVERGMVVYGQDKMDEITVTAPTSIVEIDHGAYTKYVITPEQFGMKTAPRAALVGGTPAENAEITCAILSGASGPKTDAVLLNAAAGIVVGSKAKDLAEGVDIAREVISSGAAKAKMDAFIRLTNE
ncbi:MAG: anthranilate phosphoribosyltransferase [Clostridia bacterium]|nr:anthranilate phosphoribosyltransferase [Clostridia bacterium]